MNWDFKRGVAGALGSACMALSVSLWASGLPYQVPPNVADFAGTGGTVFPVVASGASSPTVTSNSAS